MKQYKKFRGIGVVILAIFIFLAGASEFTKQDKIIS